MEIHGIRIYPQSVKTVRGVNKSPIFVHGRVSKEFSDFFYTFRPLAPLWHGHLIANEFFSETEAKAQEQFGSSLFAADIKNNLILLRGDDFLQWGASLHFHQAALLPIFREPPAFDLLKRLYGVSNFRLRSKTWPTQMRAVLHLWDDIYWQYFTTDRSNLDVLIRAHAGDSKLKMYFVDLDREY